MSDAPNEGREDKTAEEVYKESWNLLVNGEIHSSAILHAMKVYADQQTKSLRDQLSKEREMRKELVQNFKSALRRDTAIKISDVDKLIDMLNKVASELDKIKT